MSTVAEQPQSAQAPVASVSGNTINTMANKAEESFRHLVVRLFCGEEIPEAEIIGVLIPAGRSVSECSEAVGYLRRCLRPAERLKQRDSVAKEAEDLWEKINAAQPRVINAHNTYLKELAELQSIQLRFSESSGQSLAFYQRFVYDANELKLDYEMAKGFGDAWNAASKAEDDDARQSAKQSLAGLAMQILASRAQQK